MPVGPWRVCVGRTARQKWPNRAEQNSSRPEKKGKRNKEALVARSRLAAACLAWWFESDLKGSLISSTSEMTGRRPGHSVPVAESQCLEPERSRKWIEKLFRHQRGAWR